MKSQWNTYLLYASLIIIGGSLLFILVETVRVKNTGFETKTLWDWMELLIIPFVLAIGAFFLNRSERAIEREAANRRAELEQGIAIDGQQENAFQSYLDKMADLLVEKNLRISKNKSVQDVARTRTLSVLRKLDRVRKRQVIQFLYEANLIRKKSIVSLSDADLNSADLSLIRLREVALNGVNLSSADIRGADLEDADLSHADLRYADLSPALISSSKPKLANTFGLAKSQYKIVSSVRMKVHRNTNLRNVDLSYADLRNANLRGAIVTDEQLATAQLEGAVMPDGTKHE